MPTTPLPNPQVIAGHRGTLQAIPAAQRRKMPNSERFFDRFRRGTSRSLIRPPRHVTLLVSRDTCRHVTLGDCHVTLGDLVT